MTDEDIIKLAKSFNAHKFDEPCLSQGEILDFARALLSASKPAAPAQSGEAVAYRYRHSEGEKWHYGSTPQNWWECQALYTAPQPSQPAQSGEEPPDGDKEHWHRLYRQERACRQQWQQQALKSAQPVEAAESFVGPVVIKRTHPNNAYVTYGFGSEDECTQFIKATRSGSKSAVVLDDERVAFEKVMGYERPTIEDSGNTVTWDEHRGTWNAALAFAARAASPAKDKT